jgi:hypothetical protein
MERRRTMNQAPTPPVAIPVATVAPTKLQATVAMVTQLRTLVGRNMARWRRLQLLEALGLGISAPLAYLWLFFLLDNVFHLPGWGRLVASAGFFAVVGWLGYRLYLRGRNLSLSEDQVALAMEQQALGIDNRLINSLQLGREVVLDKQELREAVVHENYQRLQQVKLPRPAPARPALLKLGLAALLILLGLLFWLLRPEHFSNAASRLLLPFSDIDPLYRTRLSVEQGNIELGGDIPITIRISGEKPDTLTIVRRSQGGQKQVDVVPVEGKDEVNFRFLGVQQSLTYTVQGGDYTTPAYRIEIPTVARLALVRAQYHYPAYTRKGPVTTERASGELEALQGSRAEVTFVFDKPVSDAAILLDRASAKAPQRLELTQVSATEYRATIPFDDVTGYQLVVRDGEQEKPVGSFDVRVLIDQNPKLQLSGLDRQSEVAVDAVVPLKISATDDYGLEKVGLFVRPAVANETDHAAKPDAGWQLVKVWPAGQALEFTQAFDLAVAALNAAEGDRLEVALRGVDNDPLKRGAWLMGPTQKLSIGGDGAALQRQYEQILRTETEMKALAAAQKQAVEKVAAQVVKLDAGSGIRWDDPKNVAALHDAVKELAKGQEQLRLSMGQSARSMVTEAGNLRVSLGMLADTEMIRSIRILESVASRDEPQAKRSALADARLTQERIIRSLGEIGDQYRTFRQDWEMGHMVPFTQMLAERQAKLRDVSKQQADKPGEQSALLRGSVQRRQTKIAELSMLIQPAFAGLSERLQPVDQVLASVFLDASKTLSGPALQGLLQKAAAEAGAGRWTEAAKLQTQAATELDALFNRLRKAQTEAAARALAALKEKGKSDAEAQKEIDKLQQGVTENMLKLTEKMKLEDLVHMREQAGDKKTFGKAEDAKPENYLFPDSKIGMLQQKEKGSGQDFNILKLAERPTGEASFPKQSDRKPNAVSPFIQEKFDDLVGKLLEEADDLRKKYETYNLNAAFNINEPGDIGKHAGDLNSTSASAATGNMKPPTGNFGGASRTGRQGARSHGMAVGDKSINRRGRDKPQDGQEKVADQAGSMKEEKSNDPQKDTSAGTGGKKVDSDDTRFSTNDSGKWNDDMANKMDKAQAKHSIVERQDGRMDPRVAELMRDLTSKQEQVIERVKTIRKELKNLYLPTDHLDELTAQLQANLEALKEQPDPELFRQQSQMLDQLRNTIRVFQSPQTGFQPSLPRERVIRGRVLDQPARVIVPGYEEAVKRYYEKLSSR